MSNIPFVEIFNTQIRKPEDSGRQGNFCDTFIFFWVPGAQLVKPFLRIPSIDHNLDSILLSLYTIISFEILPVVTKKRSIEHVVFHPEKCACVYILHRQLEYRSVDTHKKYSPTKSFRKIISKVALTVIGLETSVTGLLYLLQSFNNLFVSIHSAFLQANAVPPENICNIYLYHF